MGCCICYEGGARRRSSAFTARRMKIENGKEEFIDLAIRLRLCDDCVKEYFRLAGEGLMPVTLFENLDIDLSWYQWTDEPPLYGAQEVVT